ncbi:MAG: exodeoxyribonuclease VII large subunit, partial [Xanthomonadales bacterium]|nr:exodeoxyribonuclease VII large subunit [Xanthomonadales bacterium]
ARPTRRLERGHERLAILRARLDRIARHDHERRCARIASARAVLLTRDPRAHIRRSLEHLAALASRLSTSLARSGERRRLRIEALGRALHATGPLATLARGYSILIDPRSGRAIRSVTDVEIGMPLTARLVDGEIGLRVEGD